MRSLATAALVAAGLVGMPSPAGAADAPSVTGLAPRAGFVFGGTMVKITGSGFTQVESVAFGDHNAPYMRVDSPTQITAESPPSAAGTVHVTVTTAAGSSAPTDSAVFLFSDAGWHATDALPFPRSGHTATLLAGGACAAASPSLCGQVLVAGGVVGRSTTFQDDPENVTLFDPEAANEHDGKGAWTQAAPRHARLETTATRLADGKVLVAGGRYDPKWQDPDDGQTPDVEYPPAAEIYDPAADSWIATGPMHEPRRLHTATLLGDDTVLVVGGLDALGQPLRSTEIFTPGPGGGSWRPGAPMSDFRRDHSATLLDDGRVVVAGGRDDFDAILAFAEIYTVDAGADPPGAWSRTATPMTAARTLHTATLLAGPACAAPPRPPHCGKVLVAGGEGPAPLASAELFDPASSDPWAPTGRFVKGRTRHAAALLADGRVLVAGGLGPSPLASAELYDPAQPAGWMVTGPMATPRSSHTLTALADGTALAAGGVGPLSSAEVWDPVVTRPAPTITGIDPTADAPTTGADVTIRGDFLRGASAVTFGGAPAVFAVRSNQEISATAPEHERGPVAVTVVTGAGTSGGFSFVYGAGSWRHPAGETCTDQPCGEAAATATTLTAPGCSIAGSPAWCGEVLMTKGDGSAWLYDPSSRSWSATPAMKARRYVPTGEDPGTDGVPGSRRAMYTATLLHGGKVLVAGGCCAGKARLSPSDYAPNGLASAEIYDPSTNQWTEVKPMAEARNGHSAVLLGDGRVIVVGGTSDYDTALILPSAEIYDPAADEWRSAGTMNWRRMLASASVIDAGRVLVAGGSGHAASDACRSVCPEPPIRSVEIYTPPARGTNGTGTWETTGDLITARMRHSATSLADGKVLVAGGSGQRSSELYDVATRVWTATRSAMSIPRDAHSATLLPDNKVLVVGGRPEENKELTSAELFDPVASRWSLTTSMRQGRYLHAAAALGEGEPACRPSPQRPEGLEVASYCGAVLVVGGFVARTTSTTPLALSSELYTSAPGVAALSPVSGPSVGGDDVVMTGSGFGGATTVTFGGQPAAFRVDSPSRLVATSPAHAPGPVDVDVRGPGGSSALVDPRGTSSRFTYEVSGPPGTVGELAAVAVADTRVDLTFTAAGTDGAFPPPVADYVVKQSSSPLVDEASFDAAPALCGVACRFTPSKVGERLLLSVSGLRPGTTYHFAVRARSDAGVVGPVSSSVPVTTSGVATVTGSSTPVATPSIAAPVQSVCTASATPRPGQVAFPAGYTLVGLPAGTRVGDGKLYGWFNLGSGGQYSRFDGSQAVEGGHAYWAWSRCPRLVTASAPGSTALRLPLSAYRASLVGNPSSTSGVQVSGHDYAARWDPAMNGGAGGYRYSAYRETQTLAVGEGLWVFSYRRTTIRIKPIPLLSAAGR